MPIWGVDTDLNPDADLSLSYIIFAWQFDVNFNTREFCKPCSKKKMRYILHYNVFAKIYGIRYVL
jgi:hypothetical protein